MRRAVALPFLRTDEQGQNTKARFACPCRDAKRAVVSVQNGAGL
jgi:hypothetical protein